MFLFSLAFYFASTTRIYSQRQGRGLRKSYPEARRIYFLLSTDTGTVYEVVSGPGQGMRT